jgi:hypothetical protein
MSTPQYDPGSGPYDPNAGQYGQAPGQFGQPPSPYAQAPDQYGQYGQAPGPYGQAPGQYGQAPGPYGQAPGQYGQFPQPGMPGAPGRSLAAVARKRGMTQIAIGAVVFVIGLVITIATYSSASSGGGTYVVAYGPMIFGILYVIRGFMAVAKAQKLN